MNSFERNIYMKTAAAIVSNKVPNLSTRHAVCSPYEVDCIDNLKKDIAKSGIRDAGLDVVAAVASCTPLSLMIAGFEAYDAVKTAEKFNNCMAGLGYQ